jgi:hypothetical protein
MGLRRIRKALERGLHPAQLCMMGLSRIGSIREKFTPSHSCVRWGYEGLGAVEKGLHPATDV